MPALERPRTIVNLVLRFRKPPVGSSSLPVGSVSSSVDAAPCAAAPSGITPVTAVLTAIAVMSRR